jgi:type IV secretory pathway TrbF-like protein
MSKTSNLTEEKSGTDYKHYSAWRMWAVFISAVILATILVGGSMYRILDFLVF